MSDTPSQQTLDTNAPEFRLNRFETVWLAWRAGETTPDWRQHLPTEDEPCAADLIFYLLQMDIEFRVKAGMAALLVEPYFAHPRLQKEDARPDAAKQVELIHWEYHQRLQKGERPRRSEYEEAFPQHAEALREMKPRSRCPRCRKILVLEETYQTLLCPHCGSDSPGIDVAQPNVAEAKVSVVAATELDARSYALMDTLGTGGMGEVYRCSDPALGRDLAIKVMKATLREYPEIERRFLREARITGSLQHPSIVAVHNLGRLADGRLHYTMRLVRGRTFADILKEEAGMPERLPYLLNIFEKICQAMAYAHSKRVIHRDLKPHNVMVGHFGEVQVMDWGLAKLLTPDNALDTDEKIDAAGTRILGESTDTPVDLTRIGSGLGTPAYMPPEQALGEWDAVDERADVFALGSILCEILTGEAAYSGTDGNEVYRRARRGDVAEALDRLEKCGADTALVALCRECLNPKSNGRPRNAAAVEKHVADYQVEVRERLRRAELEQTEVQVKTREERKRRRLTMTLAVVVLLVVTGSVFWWQHMKSTVETQKAVQEVREKEALRRQDDLQRDLRLNRYVADIQQAAQFWQNGEISQCYDFMRTQRWTEDRDDPCGFEWLYLRRWCDCPSRVFEGHTADVRCVRFHPNGTLLASCSGDQTIRFWDSEKHTPRGMLSGHRRTVSAIAFSPDGGLLASASHDGSVRLWNVAERRQLAILIEGAGYIESVEFSHRGDLLAIVRENGSNVRLWDLKSRQVRHSWISGGNAINSLAFAPDGCTLALGYANGTVKIRDVSSGKEKDRFLVNHPVHTLAFACGWPLLAAGGSDGVVTLWDVETRENIGKFTGHSGSVNSLAFSPDNQTLLSAGEDGTIRSWDTATQRPRAIFRARNQPFPSVAFHPGGRVFAAASVDHTVCLWYPPAAEKASSLQTTVVPSGPIRFSSDGKWLAVAGRDQTVRLLDSTTRRVRRTLRGWRGEWQDLTISSDGKYLAATCSDHRVYVWETSSEKLTHRLHIPRDRATCVAFSPNGKWLATGGADHRIAIWEMPTGQLRTTLDTHRSSIMGMAFHPENDLLATVSRDRNIKLWSVPGFQELRQFEQDEELLGVSFGPEGRTLLVNGEFTGVSSQPFSKDRALLGSKGFTGPAPFMAVSSHTERLAVSDLGSIRVYDLPMRMERFHLDLRASGGNRYVALSPDGTTLILNQREGPLQWWDLNDHQIRETEEEYPFSIHSLAFSAGGQTLIMGTALEAATRIRTRVFLGDFSIGVNDRLPSKALGDLVRFWSMPTKKPLQVLSHVPTFVSQRLVAMSPDGRTLGTGADDGSVSLWELATGKRLFRLLASRHSRSYLPFVESALATGIRMRPKFDGDHMRALTFSPDGRLLAAAGEDGQVQVWETSSGKEWALLPGVHADVSCLAFSPDGKLLATNDGPMIKLWDLSAVDGNPLLTRALPGHTATVRSLAFSPDGRLLASGAENWDMRLWDAASGAEVRQLQGHIARVSSLAFSRDGKTLASASFDGTIRLWQVATGRVLIVLQRGAHLVHAVTFSPDGTILAAGGEGMYGRGEVHLWSAGQALDALRAQWGEPASAKAGTPTK